MILGRMVNGLMRAIRKQKRLVGIDGTLPLQKETYDGMLYMVAIRLFWFLSCIG